MSFRNLPEMKPSNKPQFAGVGFDFGEESSHPVTSVNGETGAVILDAADVGALPSDTSIPTKTSELQNDSGFVDSDIIAPVEATSTASQAYTVGQYFINSIGQLCLVTVNIASGGTITVGTNCVVEPVGSALSELNSKPPLVLGGSSSISIEDAINKVGKQLEVGQGSFFIVTWSGHDSFVGWGIKLVYNRFRGVYLYSTNVNVFETNPSL